MARRRDEKDILYFPSLLDRLREKDTLTVDWSRLRELVLRDLTALLNARSYFGADDESAEGFEAVQASVVNYGLPDMTGRSLSPAQLRDFTRSVESAIRRYEPRLRLDRQEPVKIVRSDFDEQGGRVSMQIRAELNSEPFPEWLCITTQIDVETGRCAVTAASEQNNG
jgi:type VI secretion system protein ImpF